MAGPIFISHVFEDGRWIKQLQNWNFQNQLGKVFTLDVFNQDLPPTPDNVLRRDIKERIRKSAAVILLVGNDTHSKEWVRLEVAFAQTYSRPVIVVRIPGTTGGIPVIAESYQPVDFTPAKLKEKLATI